MFFSKDKVPTNRTGGNTLNFFHVFILFLRSGNSLRGYLLPLQARKPMMIKESVVVELNS